MRKYFITLALILILGLAAITTFHSSKSSTSSSPTPTKLYVAMGDSVAAGVGLKYDSDSSACDRTNQSYPNQVAKALNYKLDNLACSGATLPAGILGSQNVNDLAETPQIQELFKQPRPSLITITIGANDANWTKILQKCYTSECGDDSDTASVTASLATVTTNLQTALSQIQTQYKTNTPHVIVTGYHQVFPATEPASCTDLTGIDAHELAWGRQLQTNISSTLQRAVAGYSFATYVPVNFSGHELCTPNSWVQGLSDPEPYHPTAVGQTVYATAIEAAVKAFK